jgi:hypothetical protein
MDDDTRALYLATIAEMNRQITAHLEAVDAIRRNRRAVRDEMLWIELAGINQTRALGVSADVPSRPSSCP